MVGKVISTSAHQTHPMADARGLTCSAAAEVRKNVAWTEEESPVESGRRAVRRAERTPRSAAAGIIDGISRACSLRRWAFPYLRTA